ncbi:hypothetical protein ONS95_014355 [Cadophora gregata]|uniref:uncharacterized protein n=1 Tax=Cadophora gregata TaxID=51156 RepID=UPI0026DB6D82|nr:uncharacterized protein ONS95_014355 [Cadophora gregata]KAK0112612.1 hypothetical protein ONS95_014355 [Cadophora gregata]
MFSAVLFKGRLSQLHPSPSTTSRSMTSAPPIIFWTTNYHPNISIGCHRIGCHRIRGSPLKIYSAGFNYQAERSEVDTGPTQSTSPPQVECFEDQAYKYNTNSHSTSTFLQHHLNYIFFLKLQLRLKNKYFFPSTTHSITSSYKMEDFNFSRHGNSNDDYMDDNLDYQLDEEPESTTGNQPEKEPETQSSPSHELIPSIERTASASEPSQVQDQINNEVESSSALKIKSEEHDPMYFTHNPPPYAARQQSAARTPPVENPVRSLQVPQSESAASAASSSPGQPSSPTSLTPQLTSASIFGGPPSQLLPSSKHGPSITSSHPIPSIFGQTIKSTPSSKPTPPPQAQEDDDDGDFMIIEPQQASVTAQQKWSSQSPQKTSNDVVFIKEERRDDDVRPLNPPPAPKPNTPRKKLDPAKLMAAQRAMYQRSKAQNNGEGSSRGHIRPEVPNHFARFEDNTFGTSDQADAVMQDASEDNSWMNEEDEADPEYEKMLKLKNLLVRKQRSKTITADESVHLYKIIKRIETRDRLRVAVSRIGEDEQEEDPNSLFLPETREETVKRRHREREERLAAEEGRRLQAESEEVEDAESESDDNAGEGEYNDDDAMAGIFAEENGPPEVEPDLGLTKAGKPRKRRAKVAKGPFEYMQRKDEQRREKERAKAQKKKGHEPAAAPASRRKVKSPVTRGRGKAKVKDKGKGKEKEKPAKKGKGKGKELVTNGQSLLASGRFRSFNNVDPVGHMILEDLMNNDPISDRLQNPIFNRPAEETISGHKTKATQFQLLFANIPEPEDALTRGAVRSDKAKLRDASKSFGYAKCKAVDGKWLIKGMNSTLYHHQLLGAQWMVERELSSQPPHGGLLADSMGLGKTVQTLACMVGNPPGLEDIKRKVKATLIVAPATIVKQWTEEIEAHVNDKVFPKILHYKSSSTVSLSILEDIDIVVTSYNVVMKQFPWPDKEGRMEIARHGYPAWAKGALEKMGLLHQVNWYRVVLDEAQAIKNNSARTSLACQNLKSVYRLCLTGTPLLNRLEELFPYLRFLKANYSMDWAMFQKYFCDPDASDCYNRIATLLSYTMMRRTMKTSILNRPILTLPEPHPHIQYVNFSPEETIIYRITENRFRNNLNAFFKKGDASRNYGFFMVQLLRLRQCTSHPFMLERTIKESWTMEDVQELKTRMTKIKTANRPFYEQCQLWVETSEAHRAEARARGEVVPDDEMLPFGQSSFGHTFDMEQPLGTLDEGELYKRVTCSLCSDVPTEPLKTDCGHVFCKDCIDTFVNALVAQENEYMTCPECNRIFDKTTPVINPLIDDGDTTSSSSRRRSKNKGKGKGREGQEEIDPKKDFFSRGRDLMGFEPMTNDSTWISKSDREPGFVLTPSTKTTALKALLLKGFEEAPLDKVGSLLFIVSQTLFKVTDRAGNIGRPAAVGSES